MRGDYQKMTYADLLREAQTPVLLHPDPGPEYADPARVFQGMPAIERAPGGRLWSTWCSGGQGESPLNYILLATSADDGEHWRTAASWRPMICLCLSLRTIFVTCGSPREKTTWPGHPLSMALQDTMVY